MADAAVTFLLDNVTQLLKHKISLIAGAEVELELLKKDLVSLKAFLHDAAGRENKPEGFRDIESRIRDVVYEAEDTIDSCMTHAAAAKNKNFVRRALNSTKRLTLAEEVQTLRDGKVVEMVATAQRFAATEMVNGSETTKARLPNPSSFK